MYDVEFNEEWRPIDDFPYLVSNFGNVVHESRPSTIRKLGLNHQGFPTLTLFHTNNPSRYVRQVNKLVANAFLTPPEDLLETAIWHFDGDLTNCRVDNLKWERRDRVLDWNEAHRRGTPKYRTPRVMNTHTGEEYENAYECAMAEGVLEGSVIHHIETRQSYPERGDWRYV